MHELSIAMSILDIAEEESDRRGGAEVAAIHMRLGALSGVVKEALTSAFELAREMSPFAEARLVIEDVPVTVDCLVCRQPRPVKSIQMMACRECGTLSANIVSGQEMEITAMEMGEPPQAERPPLLKSEI